MRIDMGDYFYRAMHSMTVIALNAEQHLRTCGYWYLVQGPGTAAHTAFKSRQGLERWLDERGLKCEIPTAIQPEDYGRGLRNSAPVHGAYGMRSLWDTAEFYALPAVIRSKTLSNGDWVEALITEEGSIRIVNTLNPNVRERKTFPWQEIPESFK